MGRVGDITSHRVSDCWRSWSSSRLILPRSSFLMQISSVALHCQHFHQRLVNSPNLSTSMCDLVMSLCSLFGGTRIHLFSSSSFQFLIQISLVGIACLHCLELLLNYPNSMDSLFVSCKSWWKEGGNEVITSLFLLLFFSNLISFQLKENQFSTLLPEIGQLSNLTQLDVRRCTNGWRRDPVYIACFCFLSHYDLKLALEE